MGYGKISYKPSGNTLLVLIGEFPRKESKYSYSRHPFKCHPFVVYSFDAGSPVILGRLGSRSDFIPKAFIRRYQTMKINGLEDLGITESDLVNQYAVKRIDISIRFSYYPDMESLKPLTPKERRLVVCQYFRDQLKVVKNNYPTTAYQLIGSPNKPRGITGQLTGQQLVDLQSNEEIKWVTVEQVEGLPKIQKDTGSELEACALPFYFSVKALFVAEFDGIASATGVQLTEERIVLVKALTRDGAIRKARVEFAKYSQAEIFTNSYQFNTWKFLKMLDVYDLGITSIDPEGTEVYSVWKRRKLKESDYENNNQFI